MIFRIFRKILSVVISAVFMLPLFACSADQPVKDLYEAYVAEKDSLIVEREEKETTPPAKEPAASAEQVLTAGQAGGAQPEEKETTEPVQNRQETRTSVESVRPEVSSEVTDPAAETVSGKEELQNSDAEDYLSEEADPSAQENAEPVPEDDLTAGSYTEEGEPEGPLGSAAFALVPGAGSGQFLKLDEEGTVVTLTAREMVYDVTLTESGADTENYSHQFMDSFHADVMESGETITLQARIDSDMPDICISWTSAEGATYTKFIGASAKDDVLMLVTVE